jgi:hypothetical protein
MWRVFLFLIGVACAMPVWSGQQPSLVVAVDSSRSLKSADIEAVHDALSRGLKSVPSALSVGLVTFDDTARWVIQPTADRQSVLQALAAVQPSGTTTVLYDGIFLAAQAMDNGGAVLIVSDGKDENSAVTVPDIEGLCARQDIRLLTVGIGRNIDDKTLRRLALLTRGVYFGNTVETMAADLPGAVDQVMLSLESVSQSDEIPEIVAPAVQTVSAAATPSTGVEHGWPVPHLSWQEMMILGIIGVLVLLGVGVALWILRRRRSGRCPKCGALLSDDGGDCPVCRIEEIRVSAEHREVAEEDATRIPDLGVGAMAFETRPDDIDRTVAMGEVAVLTVHEEGREVREYTLPRDRIFAVGRAPRVNTLQVKDQTVSAQHFKIVYKDNHFYVVDLWTTNGTSVNHECVRVHPLEPGDVIRAGLSEFVFSSQGRAQKSDAANKVAPPHLQKQSSG